MWALMATWVQSLTLLPQKLVQKHQGEIIYKEEAHGEELSITSERDGASVDDVVRTPALSDRWTFSAKICLFEL